tara:strand:- start:1623 stop:2381 length:759 start_codon:yes stop_codon:yes gene_type:complete
LSINKTSRFIKKSIKILIDFLSLISLVFRLTLAFLFVYFLYNNGFNFNNFIAKFLILLFVIIIFITTNQIKFWKEKEDDVNYFVGIILIVFLFTNLVLEKFIGVEFYKQEQNYVAFSARKTNNTGTYTDYDKDVDRYGEKMIEVERDYYIDEIVKKNVVKKNTIDYEQTKKQLNNSNFYVGESNYIFWQTAVVDGYKYSESNNSFIKGWFYFLELCYKTIPTIIVCIILNFIIMVFTRFKFSLLRIFSNKSF